MSDLKLSLLGSSHLERSGVAVKISTRKALALLIYLAVTRQRYNRDTLAAMFWSETDQSQARTYLRRALWMLKKAVSENLLIIEGQIVGINPEADLWLDVDHFHGLLASCEQHGHPRDEVCADCLKSLTEAVDLYKGVFLAGFTLSDSPEFDDWQFFQADSLQQELTLALKRLVQGYGVTKEFESAIPHARRWVAEDPLNEAALRALMNVYYRAGQISASLRQYELFVQLLGDEMNLSPEPETTSLYEMIKVDRNRGSREEKISTFESEVDQSVPPLQTSPAAPSRSNLPLQLTPFIGREVEVADISQLLRDEPGCRLLTLVGAGGMGKTRLALEAAAQVENVFKDGAYFVPLAPVGEVEHIISAIAGAIKFNFQGESDRKAQLFHHLSQKIYLLVMDNFEQLLSAHGSSEGDGELIGGEQLLSEIMDAVQQLKFLVTSRERLNLQEEWSYEVQGMPFPQASLTSKVVAEDLEHYASIQLFLQRARKAEASFTYSSEDLLSIAHICQSLGGMPLGIELAAPWVRVMSCREIAAEIDRSFDLLTTSLRNVPERHRSMRAILEQTWRQLSVGEQTILSKLSIFQGGCTREAAEFVSGATLQQLSSLVDKALIRRISGGRYELHELIRQFALEQLRHAPDKYDQTKNRHYRYFTAFLQQRVDDLKSSPQLEAVRLISADIDNVRSAWQWAVESKDRVALERAAEGLYLYSEIKGSLVEGETAFRQAVHAFNLEGAELNAVETSLRGFLLVGQGSLRAHRGDLEGGQALLEQGLALLNPVNNESPHLQKRAFALMRLGWVLFLEAKNVQAEPNILESLDLYTEIGDRWGEAKCLSLLGNSLTGSGRLAEAEPPLRKSLAICQDLGDRRSQLLVDWNLAILTFWFGDYAQTELLLNDAVRLGQELDDQIGLAFALKEIGKLEVALGKYSQAIQTFEESIAITDEIGSHWESAATLEDLSLALIRTGDYAAAEDALRQCLEASQPRQHHYFIARCIGDFGLVAYYKDQYQQAEEQLRQALDIWMDLGHELYIAWVQCQLGHVLAQTRSADAGQHYKQALQLSLKHNLAPIAMDVFLGAAGLMGLMNENQYAINLLIQIESNPASTAETRESGRVLMAELDDARISDTDYVDSSQEPPEWQVIAAEIMDMLARSNWD